MSSNEPVNLAFNSFESESGTDETLTPIIFLHGLSSSKKQWDDIPQTVADKTKRKVYAIDARNHGDSPFTNYISIETNADDILHFMDNRNIKKAILVGHSMGGRTTICAALKKPERIEKIFVEDMGLQKKDSTCHFGLKLLQLRKESITIMPKGLSENEAVEFSNNYVREHISKQSGLPGQILDDILKTSVDLKKTPGGGFDLNCNISAILQRFTDKSDIFYHDPKDQYFAGPAYFLFGSASSLSVKEDEQNIRKHFPNAELIEFPNAGHNIHIYFPVEFVDKIINNL